MLIDIFNAICAVGAIVLGVVAALAFTSATGDAKDDAEGGRC